MYAEKIKFNYRNLDSWLFILVLACTFIKILLVGKGLLAFPDETRVFASANMLRNGIEGNLQQVIVDLFSTNGRPGEVLLNLIPVSIQYITGQLFNLSTFQSSNTWPFFLFNFITYLGILWFHYKIAFLLFKKKRHALLSVLLLVCLVNGYIYLRHALPYDKSLVIFYFLIYRFLSYKDVYKTKNLIAYGALAFFGFLVYPGYIISYIIVSAFFFFFRLKRKNVQQHLKKIAVFALGGGILFLMFELLSRAGGVSYLAISSTLSNTIIQGDFSESFSFIISYLYEVEGVLGILILIGVVLYVLHGFIHFQKTFMDFNDPLMILTILIIGLWFAYACAGYVFHKVTFYGRLIHQFIPLMCLITVSVFSIWISSKKWGVLSVIVLTGISVFSFLPRFIDYLSYDYPKDVAWSFEDNHPDILFTEHCEAGESWSMLNNYNEQHATATVSKMYHIVNACFFYPIVKPETVTTYVPPQKNELLIEVPYFQNFIAYQFEGLSPEQRRRLQAMDLKIKIYHLLEK